MAITLKEKPIFIIGAERSGTTLVLAIIGSHPRIAAPEVVWLFPRFYPYLYTYGDLSKDENFRTLAKEMFFNVSRWGLHLNPTTAVDTLIKEAKERSFAGLYDALYQAYARQVGKPRWVEKTPHNVFFIGPIKESFPNAQFIHIIRDGRDAGAEYIEASFGPTNALAAAEGWKLCVNAVKSWRKKLSSSEFMDITYEELTREPEKTLKKICLFLGEDYSSSMLDFWKMDLAQRRATRREHKPLGSPVTTKHIGKYKRLLSLRDQGIFAAVVGKELKEHGYAVDVEPKMLNEEDEAIFREKDEKIKAALLTLSGGPKRGESYKDWLADQREARKQKGVWKESDASKEFPVGFPNEDFITGMRASRRMKEYFGIRKKYEFKEMVSK